MTVREIPRLKTAKDVAEATGLRLHQIYLLCRTNRIPYVAVGRSYWFDPEAIRVWIQAGGTKTYGLED